MDLGILSQLLPLFLGIGNSVSQGFGTLLANLANQGRYDEGLKLNQNLRDTVLPDQRALAASIGEQTANANNDYRTQFQDLIKKFTAADNNITAGYTDRYNRNMKYLEGAGDQEKVDINRRFDNQRANAQSELTNRGLVNTAILPGAMAATERGRSDALGGLLERLRGQRIATDTQLSGDVLNSQSSGVNNARSAGYTLAGNDFQNRLAALQQLWGMGTANNGLDVDLTNSRMNWIGNRNDVPPSQSNFLNLQGQLGQAFAPRPSVPKAPSPWDSFGANAAGTGVGVLGVAGLSSLLGGGGASASSAALLKGAVACVAAETLFATRTYAKKLSELAIGDYVMNDKFMWRKIIAIALGPPHRRDQKKFLEICAGANKIVLTEDHIIGGKPAGEWTVGESIRTNNGHQKITSIQNVRPRRSGCILFRDGSGYFANGFATDSMLARTAGLV